MLQWIARMAPGTGALTLSSPHMPTATHTPTPSPGSALPPDLATWVPAAALGGALIGAIVVLLIYGWPSKSNANQAANSVVRAWIAVSLTAALILLAGFTLGGGDSNLRNIIIGGLVASGGTAIAFYFAAKATQDSTAALLQATGAANSNAGSDALIVAKLHAPLSAPVRNGNTVDFQFKVTNKSSQPLTKVLIADTLQPPAADAYQWPTPGSPGTLRPGETVTASARYTITAADMKAGSLSSRTSATGTPPSGPEVHSITDVTTTPLPRVARASGRVGRR